MDTRKINYIKAMRILQSEEYKEFISQFENTNERPFNNDLQKMVENLDLDPDEIFDKCFVVYDSFLEKFVSKTIHKYYVTPEFKTFNSHDIKRIIEWLNNRLKESSIDDFLIENL